MVEAHHKLDSRHARDCVPYLFLSKCRATSPLAAADLSLEVDQFPAQSAEAFYVVDRGQDIQVG